MGRTTLEYDDKLLHDAQEALGTKGIKATIEKALEEIVRDIRRREFAERIRRGEQIGPTLEELKEMRSPYPTD